MKTIEEIAPEIAKNLDDYTFLGNCPPTLTYANILP